MALPNSTNNTNHFVCIYCSIQVPYVRRKKPTHKRAITTFETEDILCVIIIFACPKMMKWTLMTLEYF